MDYKRRSPGAATPRLLEPRKKIAPLSRFRSNSNPNQGISKDYIFPLYSEALAKAQADPSRENLKNWEYWLKLLPSGLLSGQHL